ncbi:hypothetical protein L208DRAFT_1249355 [Tricholoma matsutake]|nr:hypothetical protein L208DRAFT_1249355 [Tricholoma matsutake 945]
MLDERTGPKAMWFNSPLHGNQKVGTLVDMIQVGQWYGVHEVSPITSLECMLTYHFH